MKKYLVVIFMVLFSCCLLFSYEPPTNVINVTWENFLEPLISSDGKQVFSMDVTVKGVAELKKSDNEYYLALIVNKNERMAGYLSSVEILKGLPNSKVCFFFSFTGKFLDPFRFLGYRKI